MEINGSSLFSVGLVAFYEVRRPTHRKGRVLGQDLAQDEMIEEPALRSEVQLDTGLGERAAQFLDVTPR